MNLKLGQLIAQARKAKGWTQDDLAERLNVHRGYVGQLEAGTIKLPGSERLAQLEQLLGISREDMLRAAGRLGPPETLDLLTELRRITSLPSHQDRVVALKQLPPEVLQAIEDLAVDVLRQAIPRVKE
jgi:transcriptional regulator with XRE-family HTH domain